MTTNIAQYYVLALGSNRAGRAGRTPQAMLRAACTALTSAGVDILKAAAPISTAPLGPARRRFANSALLVQATIDPPALLALIKRVERDLGRRRGRRWGARPIDIDIIFWSGGCWHDHQLCIPHPGWRSRDFVLRPVLAITPQWRDPLSGWTPRHWNARLRASRPTRQKMSVPAG